MWPCMFQIVLPNPFFFEKFGQSRNDNRYYGILRALAMCFSALCPVEFRRRLYPKALTILEWGSLILTISPWRGGEELPIKSGAMTLYPALVSTGIILR